MRTNKRNSLKKRRETKRGKKGRRGGLRRYVVKVMLNRLETKILYVFL